MFFDKKPTVYHLRRFGCLAYNKTMSNRRKFDPRAEKMIFCRYDWESKSYILYSMKKRFISSRNVKFDEQQFYYSVSKDSSRSFAFQPVVNNLKTEIPTVNNQDSTMILVFYLLLQQMWMNQHIPKVHIRFSYPLTDNENLSTK